MTLKPTAIHTDDAPSVKTGGLGVRFLLVPAQGSNLSIVEHPLDPHTLGSPIHTHSREDEISYVLEGEVGVQVGDEVTIAGPGTLIVKPRGIPHAFWNAGDKTVRLLEIISPSGFEEFFKGMAQAWPNEGEPSEEDMAAVLALANQHGLAMDMESVPGLMEAHGLIG